MQPGSHACECYSVSANLIWVSPQCLTQPCNYMLKLQSDYLFDASTLLSEIPRPVRQGMTAGPLARISD